MFCSSSHTRTSLQLSHLATNANAYTIDWKRYQCRSFPTQRKRPGHRGLCDGTSDRWSHRTYRWWIPRTIRIMAMVRLCCFHRWRGSPAPEFPVLPRDLCPHFPAKKVQAAEKDDQQSRPVYQARQRVSPDTAAHKCHQALQVAGNKTHRAGLEPILCIYLGVIYLIIATFPKVWTDIYGESVSIGSLNYFSQFVGMALASQLGTRLADRYYNKRCVANGGQGLPEFRLPILTVEACIVPIRLFIYGWGARQERPLDCSVGLVFSPFGSFESPNIASPPPNPGRLTSAVLLSTYWF